MNTKVLLHFCNSLIGGILTIMTVMGLLIGTGFAINYLYEYPVRWLGYIFLATKGAKDIGIVVNDTNAFSAGFGIIGTVFVTALVLGMFGMLIYIIVRSIRVAWNNAREKAKLES